MFDRLAHDRPRSPHGDTAPMMVSFGAHAFVIGLVALVPLLYVGAVPEIPGMAAFVAAPPPLRQEPVRIGGAFGQPELIGRVAPVYPPVAEQSRVGGIVVLEAVVGSDGHVDDVRVLRSVPLLDRAAIDAVRQWRYSPLVLDGRAVPFDVPR